MGFNENQKKAINYKDGPLIIVAGPGSGKTTVIVNRTKTLIEKHKINPKEILVSTFTKSAALEMADRYQEMSGIKGRGVTFGTIHSICLNILRKYFGYSYEKLCTENAKYGKLYSIYKRYHFQSGDQTMFIRAVSGRISYIKNTRADIHDPKSFANVQGVSNDQMEKMYLSYIEEMEKEGKYDFDDILLHCHKLLEENTEVLSEIQEEYKYFMIDEFQDCNRIQADIFYLLAEKYENIAIVGDDDQSLYRFRAADPSIMLDFRKTFPNAEKIILGTNYRSDANIVKASRKFIDKNKERFPKNLEPSREEKEGIHFITTKDEKEEINFITDAIEDNYGNGIPYSEMAVIYRTNKESQGFVANFMKKNIPFYAKKEDIIDIYDHYIYKDILNFYELANGSKNYKKWQRALKRLPLYITGQCFKECKNIDEIIEWHIEHKKIYNAKRIMLFQEKIFFLKNYTCPSDFIYFLRQEIKYEEGLENYANYMHENIDLLKMILDDLEKDSRLFKSMEKWKEYGEKYHENVLEQTKWDKGKDAISLTTMHGSKGLEYKIVFLINAIDGITPSDKAQTEEDMEEERRMFYVGMTRAKDHLYLLYPKEYRGDTVMISPYYKDVKKVCQKEKIQYTEEKGVYKKKEAAKLKAGESLYHKEYGKGEILDINGDKIYLMFPSGFKIFPYPKAINESVLSIKISEKDKIVIREDGYGVVMSQKLSKPGSVRYVVIDPETKEVIRDCSGYGYKTIETAKNIKIKKKK